LVKSLVNGLDNFATANNWLVSLYKPTVVIKVCGLLINWGYKTAPVEPEINEGFYE